MSEHYTLKNDDGRNFRGTGCEDCDLAIPFADDQSAICIECALDTAQWSPDCDFNRGTTAPMGMCSLGPDPA